MIPDSIIGAPLSTPLEGGEFRWRPYGYALRDMVPSGGKESMPGPLVIGLVSEGIDPESIATQRGRGRWVMTDEWRNLTTPGRLDNSARFAGLAVGAVALGLAMVALKGILPDLAEVIVPAVLAVAIGYAVMVFARKTLREQAGRLIPDGEGVLWIPLDPQGVGGGYAQMLHDYDQVAEARRRGRVLDTTWGQVHEAVVVAIGEYVEHTTPADKANPEWVTATRALDQVRTDLGEQGIA